MKKSRKKIIISAILLATFTAAGALYIRGERFYSDHFLPRTTVNGVSYADMTAEEAAKKYEDAREKGELVISERGGAGEKISYETFDYHSELQRTFEEMMAEQDPRFFFANYFRDREITCEEKKVYDADALEEAAKALQAFDYDKAEKPVDAELIRGENAYEIKPCVEGNLLNVKNALACIREAVDSGEMKADLEKAGCYVEPNVRDDDPELLASFEKIDKVQNNTVRIGLDGGATELLEPADFFPWISFDGKDVTVDEEAVASYVSGLANKYNTVGKKRLFQATDGLIVEVGGGTLDNYGYRMVEDETAQLITEAIKEGDDKMIIARWKTFALTRHGANEDIGSTYIEVSLTRQHMWYYKDGQLMIETDIVSGLPTADGSRLTPTGVFTVLDKLTEHTMTGSYGTSFCHYVLAFSWAGLCIHDSTWRPNITDYGGKIYLTNGSHGCVNTPLSVMAQLYDMVAYNTPIVIYEEPETPAVTGAPEQTAGN